jgi:DNA polymerase-1
MRHIIWEVSATYPVALLIKASAFNKNEIQKNYLDPLVAQGVSAGDVIAFNLPYNDKGKAPAAFIKEYLDQLMPELHGLGVKYLYVADANYFKVIAGQGKADPHFGYVLPCKLKDHTDRHVVLGLNHSALIYNPELQAKLDLSLTALASHVAGTYVPPGNDIIHSAVYPEGLHAIQAALESLHQYPRLTSDIEGFSLRFNEAGIGTIAFAWDQHNGVAFPCDYSTFVSHEEMVAGCHGSFQPNPAVRALLRDFFESYQGELTWHKSDYDLAAIIYALWMKDGLDTEGLLRGLEVMTRHFGDTKIIAYLATNSTAGNVLGLKALAHEFAGNWAVEVSDIRKVPLDKLLQYNLIDCLSTAYVRDKYTPIMEADQQGDLYRDLMLPSQKLIIQLALTGMPLNPAKVKEARAKLEAIRDGHLATIHGSKTIKAMNLLLGQSAWEKDFEDRKSKAKNPGKILPKQRDLFDGVTFNPNSGPQKQRLLYELMGLPVIDLTDTKQPATGAETLEKLVNHTTLPEYKALLEALIGFGQADKILGTFITAFEAAIDKGDGIWWLHGSFNLGGTVSGRLSSSDPNLQNLPANSVYGKLIKECFMGPDGWLFCGADFSSLEDYISALTTKDPNKLKVYELGFDGHCLRAAYYFRDQVPHIDLDDPKSVNTMKKSHPELRQESKAPTFLLTYGGTYHGMMSNLGWSEEKSKAIEKGYHDMYTLSDQYIQDRLAQATKDGYVTVAFGLRVRTPLLAQVVWGSPKMPYEAAAEGRTAGNAMGQSYGLLNNRAAVEFFQKVWDSPYRFDIKPVALIHDAIYILVRDDVEVVEWANRELIKSMQWQELPEIQHDTVKIGAALDIFWPSWAKATTLPNNADQATIRQLCAATRQEVFPVKEAA